MVRSRNMSSIGCDRQTDSASSPPEASTRSSWSLAGSTRLHMMRAVFESSTMRTRMKVTFRRLQMKTHRYGGDLLARALHQLRGLSRRVEPVRRLLHHLVLVEDSGEDLRDAGI